MAGKGRARGLVLGTAWGYMAVGIALIVYGGSTLARGGAMWRAYPPLLLGAIALLLGAMGWRMFRQRYRMAEEQRMAALDISESGR
ncbi:MAG TPA: hypothetical protein PKI11_14505 [Candidatus Hydrogenedentes bacterium]|nr:hypothetical protein [Candidatus Hydrogenedentota bacterium]